MSLLYTVLILAGNRTQITFLEIIPLTHQDDLHRYCQCSLHEQISKYVYHIYENLSLENN